MAACRVARSALWREIPWDEGPSVPSSARDRSRRPPASGPTPAAAAPGRCAPTPRSQEAGAPMRAACELAAPDTRTELLLGRPLDAYATSGEQSSTTTQKAAEDAFCIVPCAIACAGAQRPPVRPWHYGHDQPSLVLSRESLTRPTASGSRIGGLHRRSQRPWQVSEVVQCVPSLTSTTVLTRAQGVISLTQGDRVDHHIVRVRTAKYGSPLDLGVTHR